MASKSSDEIKYRILRFIDVTGFTVFDPMVRLAFGEDPQKQIKAIVQFFIIPIIFICGCIWLWWVVAPNHKTKSGEVPTPDVIVRSAVINDTFSDREKTKETDFLLVGSDREARLAEVEALIAEKETELDTLKQELAGHEADYEKLLERRLAPLQADLAEAEAANDILLKEKKAAITTAAEKIEAGTGSPEELLAACVEDASEIVRQTTGNQS